MITFTTTSPTTASMARRKHGPTAHSMSQGGAKPHEDQGRHDPARTSSTMPSIAPAVRSDFAKFAAVGPLPHRTRAFLVSVDTLGLDSTAL